ncbi:MAG: hypothetical protein HYY67_03260 [Thaumarchaeota archaeon]|nr:hypothetical protein [Nitrososphaerota archaeon]
MPSEKALKSFQKTCEDVINLDDNILYVQIFDYRGGTHALAQREEFTKLFPAEPPGIRDKIGIWTTTICSIAEQGIEFLGSNDGILVIYKNMLALIIPVKSYVMILTLLLRRSTNVLYILNIVKNLLGPD